MPAIHHNEIYTVTAGVMYTMIFNTLELPSTHVPLGLNKNGLPIGIQVISNLLDSFINLFTKLQEYQIVYTSSYRVIAYIHRLEREYKFN